MAGVLAGDAPAAARLMTLLEDGDPGARDALRALFPHTGDAHIVGVTGPPGSGKSTLVDAAVRGLRLQDRRVGVVAVDPTSPFTGGALLGDRVRMQGHSTDPDVFIRSMATRGSPGGLAPATSHAAAVLDAWGAQVIFIETVGTGQAEVDVVTAVDTVIVVTVPGMGDSVQTLKAGIMEIGDIFAVNKADRADADRTVTELSMTLALAPPAAWRPPVIATIATTGRAIPDLLSAIDDHRKHQASTGGLLARRRARWRRDILRLAEARLRARYLEGAAAGALDGLVERVAAGALDPQAAADELLAPR
jgi:LAO/AO transport system kinase